MLPNYGNVGESIAKSMACKYGTVNNGLRVHGFPYRKNPKRGRSKCVWVIGGGLEDFFNFRDPNEKERFYHTVIAKCRAFTSPSSPPSKSAQA